MKAYTDLEQSKKLAEILPIESADMWYQYTGISIKDGSEKPIYFPMVRRDCESDEDIPCWSLAALISVLPKEVEIDGQRYAPCLFPIQDKWLLKLWYNSNHTITSPIAIFSDNLIDACVAMIEKLKKLNLL
jgi:hypothetical protein